MTSNQIAAAANTEAIRHNQAVEANQAKGNEISAEGNRITEEHYKRVDDINAALADVEKQKADNTAHYQQESLRITEAMNKATADTARGRLNVEQQYADLEVQKLALDEWYKNQNVYLDTLRTEYEKQMTESKVNYNSAMINLNEEANALKLLDLQGNLALRNKSLEYQRHQWDTENWLRLQDYGLAVRKLDLDRYKFENTLSLDRAIEERHTAEFLLDTSRFHTSTKLEVAKIIVNAATNLLGSGVRALPFLK